MHISIPGDRLLAAQILEETPGLPCKVYVDTMTDEACLKYGGIPERLHVIHNGKIAYSGRTGPFFYTVDELEYWLKCYKNKTEYNPESKSFLSTIFDVIMIAKGKNIPQIKTKSQ